MSENTSLRERLLAAADGLDAQRLFGSATLMRDAANALSTPPAEGALVAFFRGDGQRFGLEGDASGWAPEQTAIAVMRRYLAGLPSTPDRRLVRSPMLHPMEETAFDEGWNACRAAMIAATEGE